VPSLSEYLMVQWLMTPEAPDPEGLAEELLNRPNWHVDGACNGHDPNLWFPLRGESILPAVAICQTCAVQPECLEYALADCTLTGVWGGVSERARRQMRSAARIAG
jgi:WhiB family transcriptional regulator, redox-sensing transcriptional regulator